MPKDRLPMAGGFLANWRVVWTSAFKKWQWPDFSHALTRRRALFSADQIAKQALVAVQEATATSSRTPSSPIRLFASRLGRHVALTRSAWVPTGCAVFVPWRLFVVVIRSRFTGR